MQHVMYLAMVSLHCNEAGSGRTIHGSAADLGPTSWTHYGVSDV